ncbi:MAG: hypothetical protein R2881_08270 [Eubacteriales bacterium]
MRIITCPNVTIELDQTGFNLLDYVSAKNRVWPAGWRWVVDNGGFRTGHTANMP